METVFLLIFLDFSDKMFYSNKVDIQWMLKDKIIKTYGRL